MQAKLPRASSDRFGAPLKPGPLKRSSRVLEKCLMRADDEGNADRVCDLRRAMVVVSSILELGRVLEVLNALQTLTLPLRLPLTLTLPLPLPLSLSLSLTLI